MNHSAPRRGGPMFVAKEVVRSSWLRAPQGGPMFVANDSTGSNKRVNKKTEHLWKHAAHE